MRKQEFKSVVPTFLCPSVSLCLRTTLLHEDSPGSLLHFFRISSHLYDHLTKETKNSLYLFLTYNFPIRFQPQGPYICWLKNERKLLFHVSAGINGPALRIILKHDDLVEKWAVVVRTIRRAQGSTGSISTMYTPPLI